MFGLFPDVGLYDHHWFCAVQRTQPVRYFCAVPLCGGIFLLDGGNSMDIHSWHRLGMWLIGAFVIGHVYMALREDIMSDDTVISTMVNGYRSHKFGKISNKERS